MNHLKKMNTPSKRFELNDEDLKKIAKGAGIAVGGALLVYIAEVLPSVNFGEYTPLIVAVASIAVNACLKWIDGNK